MSADILPLPAHRPSREVRQLAALATLAAEVGRYPDDMPDRDTVPIPIGWLRMAKRALLSEDT